MRDYLKKYHGRLIVKGPTFVGSGEKLLKKEYVLSGGSTRINVLDQAKAYVFFRSKGITSDYENFMISDPRSDLFHFLKDHRLRISDISSCFKYSLDAGDALQDHDNKREIHVFIKDPYGNPYVPGSSIKGMLRTLLLDEGIMASPDRYRVDQMNISSELASLRKVDKRALSRQSKDVEARNFNTMNRPESKQSDAVNDVMSGVIVSDSRPLSVDDLVICKKMDMHMDGKEKSMPIARECLKPGTVIDFDLTIDTSITHIDAAEIMSAVSNFDNMYMKCFSDKFREVDLLDGKSVFLGGGCGFVSKTFIYPLYGEEKGLGMTADILEKQFRGKHRDDRQKKVSPHVLKCTRYEGKLMQMGLCELSLSED
ncbi:MAG: type III-A CRISPR-associated RAMP protein Csm5 [Candidatus Weimeria sp.]